MSKLDWNWCVSKFAFVFCFFSLCHMYLIRDTVSHEPPYMGKNGVSSTLHIDRACLAAGLDPQEKTLLSKSRNRP